MGTDGETRACRTGYSVTSFPAELTSPGVSLCQDDDEFSGNICSMGETLIMPSRFAVNRVKMRSYEHFSLLLGIYHSDFFCRRGKGNENLSYFASFPYFSDLSLKLISTVGSQ